MAETIEELLVKLSADVKDYNKKLDSALRKTDSNAKKMDKEFKKLGDGVNNSMGKMGVAVGAFAGVLGAQVLTGALNLAKDAVMGLVDALIFDGIEAAQVQEDAINSMNQSLINAGRFSEEASQDMQDFASQLQSVSKVGDETTIGLLALANNFARSNEEAKRMTQAAIELDAATGMGLDSALKNLGKTTAGLAGELGESIPALRSLTAEQLKAGEAIDLVLRKFGGTAAAAVNTYSGALQQLKNAWGDTTEITGSAITQNTVVIELIKMGKSILEEFNNELTANKEKYAELVGEGIVGLIRGLAGIITALDAAGRALKVFASLWDLQITVMRTPLEAIIKVMTGDFSGALDVIKNNAKSAMGNVADTMNAFSEETMLGNVATTLLHVGDVGEKALNKIGTAATQATNSVNNQIEKTNQLAANEQAFVTGLIAMKENQYAAELALLELKSQQELEQLQSFRDADKISEQEYLDAKKGANKKYVDQIKAIQDKQAKDEEAIRQSRVQGVQSMLGALSSMQNSKNREMAEVAKGAAIFNATIAAYEGGNKAAAAVAGIPIVGPALAAAARIAFVAQGIMQVNRIRGIPFQKGTDMVPGMGRGDKIPAMLEPKERVVPVETNRDLTKFLKMQNLNMGEGGMQKEVVLRIEYVGDAEEQIRARQIENNYLNIGGQGAF